MKRGKRRRESSPKLSLNLPDLDQAKSAVLNSLPSKESQRGYRHALDEFISWYCSEPRLSFNKTVVTHYRIHWSHASLRRAQSTADLRRSDVSRTKLPIPVSSAQISLLASAASKGRRASAFVLATGSPPIRQRRSGRYRIPACSKVNEIEHSSVSF